MNLWKNKKSSGNRIKTTSQKIDNIFLGWFLSFFYLCMWHSPVQAHEPTNNLYPTKEVKPNAEIDRSKLLWVSGGHVVVYTGALITLDQLWYSDYPRSRFHFHDDLSHWKQMDKAGHALTAYHFSKLSHQTFRWAGLTNNQAALWGSISGNVFLTTIEILDGFSEQWGASWSDLAANIVGSLFFYTQQTLWHEQKVIWKYSFSQSGLEKHRPDLLGGNLAENMLKDYNGQTYWLSFNLHSLAGESTYLPPWLNIAAGYGAMGMLGSEKNPQTYHDSPLPQMTRYRQFYLSPDIDLSRIPVSSPTLQYVFDILNFIKLPAPAFEYNTQTGFQFHWMFF